MKHYLISLLIIVALSFMNVACIKKQETQQEETIQIELSTYKETELETELETEKESDAEKLLILENDVKALIEEADVGGEVAVYAKGLYTDTILNINNCELKSASLIKLYTLGTVYENYDIMCDKYGKKTIDDYLTSMITVSSNRANEKLTNMLGDGNNERGRAVVHEFCEKYGYNETDYVIYDAKIKKMSSTTSVYDCAKFLEDAYRGKLPYSSEMIRLLKLQQRTHKIPAGIPTGIVTANKTGELDDTQNDVAIVWAKGEPFVLCVMSDQISSTSRAQKCITNIASRVYQFFE